MDESIVYGGVVFFACLFKVYSKFLSPRISKALYPKYDGLDAGIRRKWDSHVVSTVHAVTVTLASLYFLLYDLKTTTQPHGPGGRRVRLLFAFSAGYFLHDLVEMVRYWRLFGRREEIAHHLVSLTGTIYITLTGQIPYAACLQLFRELSTPVVNLRWFILTSGIGDTRRRYKVVCIVMLVLFVLCRIATIPFFWMAVIPDCFVGDSYCHVWPLKLLCPVFLGMDCLNLYWARLMARIFINVVKDKIREVKQKLALHTTLVEDYYSDKED